MEKDENHNTTKRDANEGDSEACPDGWLTNEFGSCFYYHSQTMAYDDATNFCSKQQEGGKILEINDEVYESIYGFMNLEAGKSPKGHMFRYYLDYLKKISGITR